jgi:hypothetical protein
MPTSVVAAYAVGLWLATWAWAFSSRHVMPATEWPRLGVPSLAWLPWMALLPATAGACGDAAGWRVLGPRVLPAARARACVASLVAGGVFVWLSGVLLPALAALRIGVWPVLAWCVLGSALTVLPVARMLPTIASKESP